MQQELFVERWRLSDGLFAEEQGLFFWERV
jgi:hypothetical protein